MTVSISSANLSANDSAQAAAPAAGGRAQNWRGLIEEYRQYLPVTEATPVITLLEGNTPLIPAPAIADRLGKQVQVWLKYDGTQPHRQLQRSGHDDGGFQSQRSWCRSGDLR